MATTLFLGQTCQTRQSWWSACLGIVVGAHVDRACYVSVPPRLPLCLGIVVPCAFTYNIYSSYMVNRLNSISLRNVCVRRSPIPSIFLSISSSFPQSYQQLLSPTCSSAAAQGVRPDKHWRLLHASQWQQSLFAGIPNLCIAF